MNRLKGNLLSVLEKNLEVVKNMEEDGPPLSQEFVNYKEANSPASRCEFCQHFNPASMCAIIDGEIYQGGICDAYAGGWHVCSSYKVENWEAFGRDLIKNQPLQLKIRFVVNSPCGWLVLMEDSMQNNPHRFSMDKHSFINFTTKNNAWSMTDVAFSSSVGEPMV